MISYERYHGTDNDFVIIDANEYVPDRAALAREVCNDTGVDGVLFLALESQYNPPRVVMTLVQPDGSNAAMCGNGARCAAHWAARKTGADRVMLDTQAGTRRAVIDGDNVTVEMGVPAFDPIDVPVDSDEPLVEVEIGDLTVSAVNTGVPHAVAFVEDVAEQSSAAHEASSRDVDAVDLDAVAPAIRHHDAFPEGANVTLASQTGTAEFDQRTFERGVEGETRSCGTGAVAVAAVAGRLGLYDVGRPARVNPPGGELEVAFDAAGVATLHGPVEREYAAQLEAVPTPRRLDRPEV